jgi:hypothetical protein
VQLIWKNVSFRGSGVRWYSRRVGDVATWRVMTVHSEIYRIVRELQSWRLEYNARIDKTISSHVAVCVV